MLTFTLPFMYVYMDTTSIYMHVLIYMYMYACTIYACITLAWNGRPIPCKVHAWKGTSMQSSCMEGKTHAKFMHGRGDPCKVHAWKGTSVQGSCMEGDIHARFMHGRGHQCKIHAWKGTSMQGSCMEGDIHARIMHGMEDSLRPLHVPCMIHAFMHEIC